MPNKPKEKQCEKIIEPPKKQMYSKDYYQYNKNKILEKYKLNKQNLIVEEVKAWKEKKLNDPNAFNPFFKEN